MKTRKQIRYLRRKAVKNSDDAKAVFLKCVLHDKMTEDKLESLLEGIRLASHGKSKQYLRYKRYIEKILEREV